MVMSFVVCEYVIKADIEDVAKALAEHVADDCLVGVEHAKEVGLHHRVEFSPRERLERMGNGDASIGEEVVDGALLGHFTGKLIQASRILYIQGGPAHPSILLGQLVRSSPHALLIPAA